jgi:histone deacetylase complex regulatory component SIN3
LRLAGCRISVAVAASRVRELFRDSPGLVAGFNAFLPEEYKMEMEKATRYVETVRDTFGRDYPAKHDEFLDVLTDFRNNTIGTAEVASRMKVLFRDSPGLLAGFNDFLPNGYKIEVIGVDELAARVVRDLSLDDHTTMTIYEP